MANVLAVPPYLDAEIRQLARVLHTPSCMGDVRAVIDGDRFFQAPEVGRAWLGALRLHDQGREISASNLAALMQANGDEQAAQVVQEAATIAATFTGAGVGRAALRTARAMAADYEAREQSTEPELPPLPPCPWACLPGRLGDYGQAVAANMEASEPLALGAMLAALSASVPATFKIAGRAGFVEIAPVWIALCAHPGSKKSPTCGRILEPLGNYDASLHCAYGVAHQSWRETCAALPKKTALPPEPERAQTLLDDATVEALSDTLNANQRHGLGAIAAPDELKSLFGSFDQYRARGKGTDRQRWLSLWAGQPWRQNRKGRFVFIRSPRVAVVGGIQPSVAATLQSLDESDGLLERLHWIDAREESAPTFDTQPVPAELEAAWAASLRALLPTLAPHDLNPPAPNESAPELDAQTFTLSREARELFVPFYETLDRRELSGWQRGYIGKLAGQALRVALTLHCAEHGREVFRISEVSGPTMQCAITLTQWLAAHTTRLRTDLAGGQPVDQKTASARAWLARHGGRATLRDVARGRVANCQDTDDAEAICNALVRARLARWSEQTAASGRAHREIVLVDGGVE